MREPRRSSLSLTYEPGLAVRLAKQFQMQTDGPFDSTVGDESSLDGVSGFQDSYDRQHRIPIAGGYRHTEDRFEFAEVPDGFHFTAV